MRGEAERGRGDTEREEAGVTLLTAGQCIFWFLRERGVTGYCTVHGHVRVRTARSSKPSQNNAQPCAIISAL